MSGQTRNGEPFVSSGYFSIVTTEPLYPGQTIYADFRGGARFGLAGRVLFDSDSGRFEQAIEEANEKNNVSPVLSFDVANESFLSGTIEYGGQPLTNFTQSPVTTQWIRDELFNQILSDYFFWYNTQTGHYLISGLPNREVFSRSRFVCRDRRIILRAIMRAAIMWIRRR